MRAPTIRQLKFQLVLARERDHEYSVEDLGVDFVIRTNWQAPNFRIMRAPIALDRRSQPVARSDPASH